MESALRDQLMRWSVLRTAVEEEMGGPDSESIFEDAVLDLKDHFASTKETNAEEIEAFLRNVLEDDFSIHLDGETEREYADVAKDILRIARSFAPAKTEAVSAPSPRPPPSSERKPHLLDAVVVERPRVRAPRRNVNAITHSIAPHHAKVAQRAMKKKSSRTQPRHTGRDDRATTEQVLDPRTRLMLFKIASSSDGVFDRLYGCISTGKEANVYHAEKDLKDETIRHLAVKVYKTSVLVFKDRNKYVQGEHRYRNGYCRSNPRKMVKMWAEKEMRNLKRLRAAGVPCPEPLFLRNHILVMTFVGKRGWPAPRLKDAVLSKRGVKRCYDALVGHMRVMYQTCGLVHADLSEYNVLYHRKQPYVIDVSQSVERDHPMAVDFLRSDCTNVTTFFRKRWVADDARLLTAPQLYRYVTMSGDVEAWRAGLSTGVGDDEEDSVFMHVPIPRNMSELGSSAAEVEDMARRLRAGELEPVTAAAVREMIVLDKRKEEEEEEAEEEDGSEDGASAVVAAAAAADDDDKDDDATTKAFTLKGASREARREHKRLLKEQRRERRKTKMKKKVKKRATGKSRKKK
eukprot:g2938.t1